MTPTATDRPLRSTLDRFLRGLDEMHRLAGDDSTWTDAGWVQARQDLDEAIHMARAILLRGDPIDPRHPAIDDLIDRHRACILRTPDCEGDPGHAFQLAADEASVRYVTGLAVGLLLADVV